jgi:hypothetical protein
LPGWRARHPLLRIKYIRARQRAETMIIAMM